MEDYSTQEDGLPPIEEMPIIPDLRKEMGVALGVNENGKVFVFYDKNLPMELEWAEYDVTEHKLRFYGNKGHMQDIGMLVQEPLRPHVEKSNTLHLVHVVDGNAVSSSNIPLLIQKI